MLAAVLMAGAGIYLSVTCPEPTTPAGVAPAHYSDLPRDVYRTGRTGHTVRVAYPFRLHPTADPLVWEFRPGSVPTAVTHRVTFTESPEFPARLPVVVEGVVVGIDTDLIIRPNRVPGVLLISSGRVVPAASQ